MRTLVIALSAAIVTAMAYQRIRLPDASQAAPTQGQRLEEGQVLKVRLTIEPRHWEELRRKPREYVPALLQIGEATPSKVGVHLKGATGSYRPLKDKPSWTVDLDRYQEGQSFDGASKLHLNNSVEDPGYFNEMLGGKVFRDAGIPAPRVCHALLWVNGKSLGPHVVKEGFTCEFLTRTGLNPDGVLGEPARGGDIDAPWKRHTGRGESSEYSPEQRFARALSVVDLEERRRAVEDLLDPRRFFVFIALEVILGHRDGYCLAGNNYRLYFDPYSGRTICLPHGMDQLLGNRNLPWKPSMAGSIARVMLASPDGERRYRETFEKLLQETVVSADIEPWLDETLAKVAPQVPRSVRRELAEGCANVKTRLRERLESLRQQLATPDLAPLEFHDGVGYPINWTARDRAGGESMAIGEDAHDRTVLHIVAAGPTTASWRSRVLLNEGRYEFIARTLVERVEPLPFGTFQGAGIRIAGERRETTGLLGDAGWSEQTLTFSVEAPRTEVELICELRARRGEAWFDRDSLRLVRTSETSLP